MFTSQDAYSELPVVRIPTDPTVETPRAGIALCLSGGGYRAMLFHVGALWRLCELGYLSKLNRISSVSGGSITAAVLGMNWGLIKHNEVVAEFQVHVVAPIRNLASRTLDVWSVLKGVLGPGTVSDHVVKSYRKLLFGGKTLQDLPDEPRFVINATSVQSGALFRFSKPYAWDYRVGKISKPPIELAVAVAASSAFPPVLSPLTLRFNSSQFEPGTGYDLQKAPFTERVVLSDGGVYDNLGLETAYKQYDTILVSDGGGKMQAEKEPRADWVRHSIRVNGLIDNQVRSLRKRQLIDSFTKGVRKGTYWGIRTNIADYHLADSFDCPHERTLRLADVPTRLKAMSSQLQEQLINWGYAVCDAAMRKHVEPALRPSGFPYPNAGV